MLNSIYNLNISLYWVLNLPEIENRIIITIPKPKSGVILFDSYSFNENVLILSNCDGFSLINLYICVYYDKYKGLECK